MLKRIKKPFQVLISICAVGYTIWIIYTSADKLIELSKFSFWPLIGIVFLNYMQFILFYIPPLLIANNLMQKKIPTKKWLKIMFASRTASNIVSKSGSVYKAVVLKRDYGLSYIDFISVNAMSSWLFILTSVGLVVLVFVIYLPDYKIGNYTVYSIFLLLFVTITVAPFLFYKLIEFNFKNRYLNGIFISARKIVKPFEIMRKNTLLVLIIVVINAIKFTVNLVLFKVLFVEMGIDISYSHLALFIAVQQVSILVFITPGNIGIRELLFGFVGDYIGIGMAEGVMASAFLRVINYVTIFPLGFYFGGTDLYLQDKKDNKKHIGV